MAEQYIFTMLGMNKHYGKTHVLKNINLCFFPGAKIGIVGENGSGKSTVLNIMSGRDDNFTGQADLTTGNKSGIVLQEPELNFKLTVRQTLHGAFGEIMSQMDEYNKLADSMATELSDDDMQKAMDRMGVLQDKLDSADAWNLDTKLDQASDALCLPEDDRVVETLSGGERRRVALCKALLEKPDLLLLDEPTNHLDPETVSWLESQLADYPGTVIIVTHDRYFLDNVTKWILELDNGFGIPWEGNYSSWIEQKLTDLARQNKKENNQSKSLAKELDWIKMSNNDRMELSRNRLGDYERLIAKEKSTQKADHNVIEIVPGPQLGNTVIEITDVAKAFGDNKLFDKLNFSVPRSAIVGLVGPNGCGKSTLFKMLTGDEQPDSGEIKLGQNVKLAYVDQERLEMSGEKSLIEEIGDGLEEIDLGDRKIPIRQYIARFGFSGASQQKKINELSGGEKSRCHLAKVLKAGGNVLLLDEPTNDLDVNTLRMLEEALLNFSGCSLIISHDRFFLNRVCTHLLVFEGEQKVRWYEGNFEHYQQWRIKELGTALFENRRLRYRRVVS